jgi:hypothetical protein
VSAATLPRTTAREGDNCPTCDADALMASTDGRPFIMCDGCGTEYECIDAPPAPRHEHAHEYTEPSEVVTLNDGRTGIAPAWMADVLRGSGMAP